MKKIFIVYGVYLLFFFLLVGSIFLVPIFAFTQDMSSAYAIFGPSFHICHQKLSRSLCVFSDGASYWIGDCTNQTGVFINTIVDATTVRVASDQFVGYKMPICSRDLGIYGAMLLGGLAYPFIRKLDDKTVYPAIYLILALVPIGLDGSIQAISEFGFLPFVYESTNAIRLITGAIAGFAAAIYAIAILMNIFGDAANERK
jgi:uncharacterized membrane protein